MPIVPLGSTSLSSSSVPNVYTQITPPNPVISGVPTDRIGVVGTASWGPINSPYTVGNMQQYAAIFGSPQPVKYDMGSAVYAAVLQGASNFLCVRVTDDTDTAATVALLDTATPAAVGAYLTSLYTGSLGNTINAVISLGSGYTPSAPKYKLTIYMSGGIPEVFDSIGGTGATFWQNLVNAVNLGQSTSRGPSQLIVASLGTGIGAVTVTTPGSGYTSIPTFAATVGSGATFIGAMGANAATLASGGSGYAAGDKITLTGGTFSQAAIITVDTVNAGAVETFTINNPGSYTVLPSNPVAQGSTTGSGTGATFNLTWQLVHVSVATHGSGYNTSSTFMISGGGGIGAAGTLTVGAASAPAQSTYTLTGGTDGNAGITSSTLVGDDSATPRTGMYALRGLLGGCVGMLADADDPDTWSEQATFAQFEGVYMQAPVAAGYQDNVAGAVTLKQNAGIDNYAFSILTGDWSQINDPFNNQVRLISPQGFKAGQLAIQQPSGSSLNKVLNGIVATQKSAESRSYSDADLQQLLVGGLEVITLGIPASNSAFGVRLGINTSSNPLTRTDNYPRMINFLAVSLNNQLGQFIGKPMSPDVVSSAYAAITTFLQGLADPTRPGGAMIGTSNGQGQPFIVQMDTSQSALGILIANVQVALFSIIQLFVVNLQGNEAGTVSTQVLPPQLARAA